MKRLLVLLTFACISNTYSQSDSQLKSHFEAYYQQMKMQGDVQGVINAMTHLNVITPNQARLDTLAYIYTAEGRYREALNTVGIENGTNDSGLNTEVKAIALKSLNQPKRAIEFYEKLYLKSPNALLAYEMADLKTMTGNLDGALANIEYGLKNVKDDMMRSFFETNQPYQVKLNAALLYMKALIVYNQDKSANLAAAIKLLDEALAIEPNFNMAILSKDAILANEKPVEKE